MAPAAVFLCFFGIKVSGKRWGVVVWNGEKPVNFCNPIKGRNEVFFGFFEGGFAEMVDFMGFSDFLFGSHRERFEKNILTTPPLVIVR